MDTNFVPFGATHILTLLLCGGFAVLIFASGRSLGKQPGVTVRLVGFVIATALVSVEIGKAWLAVEVYGQSWTAALPLHLCRMSALLCAIMLIFRSYRIFEVAYFWGIGGSIPALLTPDLAQGFPHSKFLTFFIGHALVLSAVLFAVSGFGFRPQLRSIGITVIVSAIVMVAIAFVNLVLGTNYFYLCAKPRQPSLYDFLGPWPWYIVSVWVIGLVVAFICYAPFAVGARIGKSKSTE